MDLNNRPYLSGFRRDSSQGVTGTPAVSESLDSTVPANSYGVQQQSPEELKPPKKPRSPWIRIGGITAICVGVILGVLLVMHSIAANKKQAELDASAGQLSAKVKLQNVGLPDISNTLVSQSSLSKSALTVNGQVNVTNSVVLQPSTKPTAPVSGQLYYDQSTNLLAYYNGTQFVDVQGGGGSFTSITNNYAGNTINNFAGNTSNVTNVTNVTNGGVTSGVGAVNGTAGSIAMFTDPTTLGDSLITQAGNNLSTGNGVENVTLGSSSGASTAVLQAGTGGIALQTGAQPGTSGTISIVSGASTTQAAGDITIDNGSSIITGTIISDRGFEDNTLDNFVDGFGFHDTLSVSNTVARTGTHSLQVSVGLDPINAPGWKINDNEPFITPGIVSGHLYHFSIWVKAGTTGDFVEGFVNWSHTGFDTIQQNAIGSVTDTSAGWTEIAGNVIAPAGAVNLALELDGFSTSVGELHFVDDMTVTDLDSSTSVAHLNLGTTNAQQVTLGNLSEIAPTAIYGGGINLDSGAGNFNIQGGAFQQTTQIADFNTTGGSLNLTSTGSSEYQTGEINGFGQPLTIKTGDANGGTFPGGNIAILAGTGSSGGPSGSITIDNDGFNATSGTNVDVKDFETGTDNMLGTLNDSVFQSNIASKNGNFSLGETSTGPGVWQVQQDQAQAGIPVTPGDTYYFSAWVRANAADEAVQAYIDWFGAGQLVLNTVNEQGIFWEQITGVGTAPAGVTQAYWNFEGSDPGNQENFFDYFTVTDLSTSGGVNTLNLGSQFMQGINIGNQSEVSPTTIQGGAGININSAGSALDLTGGTANLQTADAIGATGNINIETGASSTTASGNLNIDTGAGIVTGTVVQDNDFETGTDGINSWTGGAVTSQDCTTARSGSCSLAVTGNAFWGVLQDNLDEMPVVAGHHYFFSVWVKAATGGTPIDAALIWNIGSFDSQFIATPSVTSTTAGWTQLTASGVAPAGATTGQIRIGSSVANTNSNGVQNFDDITVTDLSSSSAVSELDVGATNAQIVTIGNLNEIGTTTINGGSGITLNSGVSDFNVNGGAVNINGSGAETFSSTGGDISLSAAGGSAGGVIVKPQADTTTDFQVQSAGGVTNLFTVDSAGDNVNIGTGAGASEGYTGVGSNNFFGSGLDRISAAQFTTTSGGIVSSMSAYATGPAASPNNNFQFAIYSDSSGSPGTYIASSSVGTLPASQGWFSAPITVTLAPATTYWIVYWQNDNVNDSNNGLAFNAPIAGHSTASNTFTWQSGPNNGMPTAFPTGGDVTSANTQVSMFATYSSSGPALVLNAAGSLSQSGSAVFEDPSNSPTAFQIQNNTGTALLSADTVGMVITVKSLVITANLSINGHFITGGSTPTFSGGSAGSCSGGGSVGVTGNDIAGTVSITTGAGPCSLTGGIINVTFATPYGSSPHIILTPSEPNASTLQYYATASTIGFTVNTNSANLVPATTYNYNYLVVQ